MNLHHIAFGATDFEAALRFYVDGLGMRLALRFPEGERTVALVDIGNGSYLEIFSGGEAGRGGALLHLALGTDDCDAAVRRAVAAGARVTDPPADTVLHGERDVPCRFAFVEGPDGVCIEFIEIPPV